MSEVLEVFACLFAHCNGVQTDGEQFRRSLPQETYILNSIKKLE